MKMLLRMMRNCRVAVCSLRPPCPANFVRPILGERQPPAKQTGHHGNHDHDDCGAGNGGDRGIDDRDDERGDLELSLVQDLLLGRHAKNIQRRNTWCEKQSHTLHRLWSSNIPTSRKRNSFFRALIFSYSLVEGLQKQTSWQTWYSMDKIDLLS